MDNYFMQIEVQDGEVKAILDRLTKAQETIYECYTQLRELGVVVVKKKETA